MEPLTCLLLLACQPSLQRPLPVQLHASALLLGQGGGSGGWSGADRAPGVTNEALRGEWVGIPKHLQFRRFFFTWTDVSSNIENRLQINRWSDPHLVLSHHLDPWSPRASAACPVVCVWDTSVWYVNQSETARHKRPRTLRTLRLTCTSFLPPSFSTLLTNSSNWNLGYNLWAQFSIFCISSRRSSAWLDRHKYHLAMLCLQIWLI